MFTTSNNSIKNVKSNKFASLLGLSALALSLSFCAARPANAQTFRSFTLTNDTSETASISISTDSGGSFHSTNAGRYKGLLGGNLVNLVCNDAIHSVGFGNSYTADVDYKITDVAGALSGGYYHGGLSSVLVNADYVNPAISNSAANIRSSGAAYLTDNYLNATSFTNGVNTNVLANLVALQLAQWDIIQDGGDGLAAGTFRADAGAQTTYNSLVSLYETQAASNSSYASVRSLFIQAPTSAIGTHQQNFSTAVPEPGVIAMLAGMVIPGAMFLRRRKK
jgi:hypothetical protein